MGKIVSVKRIVGPDATGETCDIIIDHYGKMPYIEGQSYGVIPPGNLFFCVKLLYVCHRIAINPVESRHKPEKR